jgi:RNA polymerase sigma-70 factor, ECF subfamily
VDDSADDAALARRIASGDADAEAALCRRLYPRVRAYGLRHLRDRAAAADLAQHVLVVVLEALRAGRVEQPERLAAFVMGACRNTASDLRRGEQRRGALLERFGATFVATVEAEIVVDRERLATCLAHLTARERAIVLLTYFADADGDAIARDLAMTPGNVRVVRHRALAHLHECLGGAG